MEDSNLVRRSEISDSQKSAQNGTLESIGLWVISVVFPIKARFLSNTGAAALEQFYGRQKTVADTNKSLCANSLLPLRNDSQH